MFGLLSHISFLRLSSGHSGPVLTLQTYDATCASLPSPHLLLAYASVWAAFPLVVGVRCIFCICVCVCVWLGCPLKFKSSPLICLWVGFLLCGNFSCFMTPSPGQVSVPKSLVSIFVFYILSYLLLKRLGCLSGCLVSSTSIQKLFCGSCSTFKWSSDEFVGEKVVSLSYSSAILGPPPRKTSNSAQFNA